jgi:hypothetical protein
MDFSSKFLWAEEAINLQTPGNPSRYENSSQELYSPRTFVPVGFNSGICFTFFVSHVCHVQNLAMASEPKLNHPKQIIFPGKYIIQPILVKRLLAKEF